MRIDNFQKKSNQIRQDIIKMLTKAGSGHSAGPLGLADLFCALYFEILMHNPKKPDWEERDRLILSCGHVCPVLYATLAHAGYFPLSEINTLRKLGTSLQGHPQKGFLPGVETTSGPLGSGLAQAAGYAYAARMDNKRFRLYCICSDGEHDEGNHWEAVMFSAKYKLSNLTLFVDRNNIQIDGFTKDIMPLEPLKAKYEAFNWNVLEVDGHNFEAIIESVAKARSVSDKPTVIICHTIPGKGVSYMENDYKWHGVVPGTTNIPGEPNKDIQAQKALNDLRTLGGKIMSDND